MAEMKCVLVLLMMPCGCDLTLKLLFLVSYLFELPCLVLVDMHVSKHARRSVVALVVAVLWVLA
ncbi:hypothetical protein LDENG_00025330 [Lucifuga dentata]|nr:hypothetical protein LDENG_00025330 [Lucifuga dentata]